MMDFHYIIQWWIPIFLIGIIFFPLTSLVFRKFVDHGYLFAKVIGFALTSYSLFVLGVFKILPLNFLSAILILWIFAVINFLIFKKNKINLKKSVNFKLLIFEELLFLGGIIVWSYVRGHEPSINGLEKFMDFGFLNSIMRSGFMPPVDMWFPPFSINYYYFGHFTTAVLTNISLLPTNITFNLMIATLFSFTLSLAFSIGTNLFSKQKLTKKSFISGAITGLLLTLGGNLHTVYALFKPYNVDNPVPFWQLPLSLGSIPNSYWYPNATRFIPFTIHEFPIYSFVVSDLHGHVLDLMYVMTSIAIIYVIFIEEKVNKAILVLIALFISIMYMTNAWDAGIYLLAILLILLIKNWYSLEKAKGNIKTFLTKTIKPTVMILILFFVFSLPFNLSFDPSGLTHGIGILCAPSFLTKIGHLGPFLFEASHCQRSPLWQIFTLYGGFYFFVFSFVGFLLLTQKKSKVVSEDLFILALILISTFLIILPEFIYLKDIYPAHYRANTMFKLVYQAFIMLSLACPYIIFRIMNKTKSLFFYLASLIVLLPIFVYPYFAIKSYYGDLKTYVGLDGTAYLKARYPGDYDAITWLNKNVQGRPVIVEAQGDSYTDFGRISANTGLPTILGWTVHEWLWRGSYNIPSPRIDDVKKIYESDDVNLTKKLLKKYDVKYIYLGGLEFQKYPQLIEEKFRNIGKMVFQEGRTRIYKTNI